MIDDRQFIPYEKGLVSLLFFMRNHRSVETYRDPTRS